MLKPSDQPCRDVLPWGHAAVGYLCMSLAVRYRYRVPPHGPAAIAVAIGTQLPDLIDKPLAWTFGPIPSGRSLAHSLVFLAGLSAIVWVLTTRYDRRLEGSAFIGSYLSHLLADMLPAALAGEWAKLGAVLWPITPVYRYTDELDRSIIRFFLDLVPAALVSLELGITVVALALWISDGGPSIRTTLRAVRRQTVRLRT